MSTYLSNLSIYLSYKNDCILSSVIFVDAEEFLKEIQREEAAKAAASVANQGKK